MALFNELLNSRYSDGIEKVLGLQEQHGVSAVASELQGILTLEGERPEYSYVKNEKLWAAQISIGPIAAVNSQVFILNPTASNVISVVEYGVVDNAGGAISRVVGGLAITAAQIALITAGTQGNVFNRDGRWPPTPATINSFPVTQVWSFTSAALNAAINITGIIPAGGFIKVDCQAVLPPGTALALINNTVNQNITVYFRGYERPMQPEEKAVG